MTTEDKNKQLINESDINKNKAEDVKKLENQSDPANRSKPHEANKESKGAEARDSNEPYEDTLEPESYDTSVADKMNVDQADQAAL